MAIKNRTIGQKIKFYSLEQVIDKSFRMASWASDDMLLRGINLLKKLAVGQKKQTLNIVKEAIINDHPAKQVIRKVMKQVHPNCKKHLLRTFIVKLLLYDASLKNDFKREFGYNPPVTVLISPSMRCNLKCFGCYANNYQKKQDMDPLLFQRTINESKQIGVNLITVLGGEPFLYSYIWDIFAANKDVVFQVFTNGTRITADVAARIRKMGNVAPVISIEGFEKQTDERRGRGVFKTILRAMDYLRAEGCLFFYSVTSTRNNAQTITSDGFVDLMIEKGAMLGWIFNYMPVGGDRDISLMPTPQQRNLVRQRTAEIRTKKPILLIDFFGDGALVNGCLAGGKLYLHINNEGHAEPCIFCHFATDNITKKSLVEVLNSPFFKGIRQLQPYCNNDLRPCMLIDHPHVFRSLAGKYKPKPTSRAAQRLLDDLTGELDKYGQDLAKLYDPIWQNEYGWVNEWRNAA